MIEINIQKDRQLHNALKKLNWRVSSRLIGNATRSGGALLRKYARSYVPKDTGRLRKAVAYKRTFKSRFAVQYSVGFEGSQAYKGQPLELGGTYKIGGGKTRYQPAHPMLRRAIDQHHDEVEKKIVDMLWKGIQREAMKNAR